MRTFFSIITPPFDPTSGGIRVMWALYGWLLAKGQIAYINVTSDDKNFVAVYPEIYPATNEAGAKTVVRYILNKPGTMALYGQPGPTEFNPNDKIYVFSRMFDQWGLDDNHILFLPVLDLHVFKDQGKKRTKSCFLVGKGTNMGLHPKNSIEINRRFAADQQALADLMNRCEVFYCYDPITAMTEIARLCGTRVVMANPVYNKEQYRNYEPGTMGMSWGKDEGVALDTEAFRRHYTGLIDTFQRRLDYFIEDCRNDE